MSTRIVTVFGATGKQGTALVASHSANRVSPSRIGSSVVNALLADGTFIPRAVTRNPNSEAALKLKQLGAEVVKGDLWDVASLKNAMKGAEGVFGVTRILLPSIMIEGPSPRSQITMTPKTLPKAKPARHLWEGT